MALVSNDVVQLDWDSALFITKNKGQQLVGAAIETEKGGIVFVENRAFAFIGSGTKFLPAKSVLREVVKLDKEGNQAEIEDYEEFIEIATTHDGVVLDLNYWGLGGKADEIVNRLKDLSGYWYYVERATME